MGDGRVYFLSDREGGMNIWSMNQEGADLKQHTTYQDWDIQELSGKGSILVFRLGADIWTMDIDTGTAEEVAINIITDREQTLVEWETNPGQFMGDTALSNDGKRVAFVSRGELFAAPVGTGRLVHVSRDSGVRYRYVRFAPDSMDLYALSDRSGELEWWRTSSDGLNAPVQITNEPNMLKQRGVVSPDGAYMVHAAYSGDLWLVDLKTGETNKMAEPNSYVGAWSPDSKFFVYSHYMPSLMDALFVYDIVEKSHKQITSDRFMNRSPAFSKDGNWLFFVSSRTWRSSVYTPWGERAPQPHFEDRDKIYAMPLRDDVLFPISIPNELSSVEETKTEDKKEDENKEAEANEEDNQGADKKDVKKEEDNTDSKEESALLRWDLSHLLREIPVSAGSYSRLSANDARLFYLSEGDLMALDFKAEAKPIRLVEGVYKYELSGDGKQIQVRKGSKMYVIPATSDKDVKLEDKNEVLLSGLRFRIDKQEEWKQIYFDAWRMHRDYFWDPNMHGVDWVEMREKYATLLPRVGAREELTDLQAMLVSELSLLHSSAYGGDKRQENIYVGTASLGGVFERDRKTKGFKLVHRYEADPDLPNKWSPLAHPDVQIDVGSIILSVNGQAAGTVAHMGELLMDQAGKQVRIQVQDSDGTPREVVAIPMSSGQEYYLRYHEWEYTRRVRVDELSNGSIGYVHLKGMSRNDIGQWTREFYSQTKKQGLIIDMRHNTGGNIDSWILGQLLRRAWAYFKRRTGFPYTNMQYSFNGHLVVLVDERTASDGEAFADGFRRLGLGKSIGMRTWGGEVWLSSSNIQVDGGIARASETGVYGPEGEWLVEGWGYEPDIEVDNPPHHTYKGQDAQLEAAVEHLQSLIKEDPRVIPDPPPYPTLVPGSGFPTPWHHNKATTSQKKKKAPAKRKRRTSPKKE